MRWLVAVAGAALLSLPTELEAQERLQEPAGAISGTVFDSTGAAGLPGVRITLSGRAVSSTTSNASGAWEFNGLPPGEYAVSLAGDDLEALPIVLMPTEVEVRSGVRHLVRFDVPGFGDAARIACEMEGADASRTLVGRVSSHSGLGLVDAIIAAVDEDSDHQPAATVTGADGRFYLCPPAGLGSDLVVAATFSDQTAQERVDASNPPTDGLDFVLAAGDLGRTEGLLGTVRDQSTGVGIPGVLVTLPETGQTTSTNVRGEFLFNRIDPGLHTLRIEHLGYESRTEAVRVAAGGGTLVDATLSPDAIELDALTVTVEARDWFGALAGRQRRMLSSRGTFLLEDEIRTRLVGPGGFTNLLRGIPGVSFRNHRLIVRGRPCSPSWILDGYPVRGEMPYYSPSEIAWMEVYVGPFAPGDLMSDSGCLTVAVFTRRPGG